MAVKSAPYYTRQLLVGLSTDPKPEDVQLWALFIEEDTGRRFRFSGGVWLQDPEGGSAITGNTAVIITSPSGNPVMGEVLNQLTDPPTRLISAAGPVAGIRISFTNRGAAPPTAQELRVVFGADNDADADTKLAAPGQRYIVVLDRPELILVPVGLKIGRVDFASDAATEAGSTKIFWSCSTHGN